MQKQSTTPVPFDIAYTNPITLPQGFHVAYQTTNVIVPHVETELEYEKNAAENTKENNIKYEEISTEDLDKSENDEEEANLSDTLEVPEPYYTDIETEKTGKPYAINYNIFEETTVADNSETHSYKEDESPKHEPLNFKGNTQEEQSTDKLTFKATQDIKRPEIKERRS